ncbi:xanthine/uracil/vitamin C permease [Ligilactobacillus acidipiscis]|nr:xanthine/uracil/vitamin C permease [Ligilactobacillus acidipiscis]
MSLGFRWQEALALVFFCGLVNIIITVTKIRKMLISAIPVNLQVAISGGIGCFIAYIGLKNAGFLQFKTGAADILSVNNKPFSAEQEHFSHGISSVVSGGGIVPSLSNFNNPEIILAVIGVLITVILLVVVCKIKLEIKKPFVVDF